MRVGAERLSAQVAKITHCLCWSHYDAVRDFVHLVAVLQWGGSYYLLAIFICFKVIGSILKPSKTEILVNQPTILRLDSESSCPRNQWV